MAIALRQAEIAVTQGWTPFGAAVVHADGNLVGEGHNSVRADLDPTAHGEIVAILDRVLQILAAFPWTQAHTRTAVK